jgi:hypothetical protein
MARQALVLASLMSASLALAACGGHAKVAETTTTTTTLAPLTLPTSLSTVEAFFDGQGGGGWKKGPLMTGSFASGPLFNVVGMAQGNDTCPASISGPSSATAVSVIDVHCATAGPPNTTFQQVVALYVAAVQKFAPAGVTWTEDALRTNTSATNKKTFGNTVLEVDIAPVQETANLGIRAKGF